MKRVESVPSGRAQLKASKRLVKTSPAKDARNPGRVTAEGSRHPRLGKWHPVDIEWEDAFYVEGNFHSEQFIRDYKPSIRYSTGRLLAKTATHVFLTLDDDRASNSGYDCSVISIVPICLVRKISPLKPIR